MSFIPPSYDPQKVEHKWTEFWREKEFYKANLKTNKPPFCIVMPPPNVTGILHMGHVLGTTLQDIISRYKRMKGFEVLWIPGLDHAGIATQTVVERDLINRENKRRRDLSRTDFEKLCWDWTDRHKKNILSQIEQLGASCDFTRLRFTLDPKINEAVRTLFKKLYDEKLIYRGFYLVNWDPITQTALADDEVEYEERQGFLYHIRYPISGTDESLTVATTRPETLFGDTAVAISPKDKRYLPFLGHKVLLPLAQREIPILSDPYVDAEFGTGVVKITPAHDPNDYEVALRHKLPMINLMTPDGRLNHNAGPFEGLKMEEARLQVVEQLKREGFLVKKEPYTHRVGLSYRSKAVIEPYLSKQWFIRMSHFGKKLKQAVESKKVKLHPPNWENTYFHWIDNLRDWCISRQLWWGHRIPIWYHKEDPQKVICFAGNGIPPEVQKEPSKWKQEEDVLDTWFSSALWPFSTLGWPNQTEGLKKFYPNSLIITGHDILFFWVARMMMMGEYALNELPFPDVILTGLIYGKSYWRQNDDGSIRYVEPTERLKYDLGEKPPKDVFSKWEKISKSKGNAIDPKEIIDLYGTCAMRMALCSTSCQLRQIDLDRRRFEEFKNFTNKVWNGARFTMSHLENLQSDTLQEGLYYSHLCLEDRWILNQFNQMLQTVNDSMECFHFDIAAQKAYEFFWNEFCAYYLEISKPTLFGKVGGVENQKNKKLILLLVLLGSIRVLHPMAPFITEELFHCLKEILPDLQGLISKDSFVQEALTALVAPSCMISPFPKNFHHENLFDHAVENFSLLTDLIYTIRNIRGEMKINPSIKTDVYIKGSNIHLIKENFAIIQALTPIKQGYFNEPCLAKFSSSAPVKDYQISIPLPEELLSQERKRLEKEVHKKSQNLEGLRQKLENPNFVKRAPTELVQKQRKLIEEHETDLKKIQEKLSELP